MIEEQGKVNQLLESFNGHNGSFIVLEDADALKINEQLQNIKAAKQVVGYSYGNGKHRLALLIDGKIKIDRSKE